MKPLRNLAVLFSCLACVGAVAAQRVMQMRSFFPRKEVAASLVSSLDIASFRSSLGPRRGSKRTFAELGMVPSKVTESAIEFEDADWYYGIRVLQRSDSNNDGVEDLEVCFTDRAKQGSYSTQQPMLVTKYSASSLAVALAYRIDGCDRIGGED